MVAVDPRIIERLSADGFIPVVAPIAVDQEDGRSLNVNADPFAAKLAAAMRAEKLVLLTDVPGVKGADGDAALDADGGARPRRSSRAASSPAA